VKEWLKSQVDELGLYVKWRKNLPRCADWLLDVERCLHGRSPEVVLDIGANVGQTTRQVLDRFPQARVHAFEPVGSTFAALQNGVRDLASVRCYQLGFSDREGSATIQVVPGSVFNSLDSRLLAGDPDAIEETITLTTVDRFLAERGLRTVDLLKTDTEGHDLKVLLGAREVLERGDVKCIYAEVTFSPGNSHNTQFTPVFELLQRWGYRFMGLYEMEYFQTKKWDESFCNALFARSEMIAEIANA
jgi:FkbM family methyltransferase